MKIFSTELLLFDRTSLGRVARKPYWLTMLAYAVLFFLAFEIPFETAYQLEMEPNSAFILVCVNAWVLLIFLSIIPIWRMTRRRLHDANLSGIWQWLIWLPVVGWSVLAVLLMLPSSRSYNRFDRFAEVNDIQ